MLIMVSNIKDTNSLQNLYVYNNGNLDNFEVLLNEEWNIKSILGSYLNIVFYQGGFDRESILFMP
ncbi:hypothetical protein [Anaerosacchariphilus polymeriproducens]|uniref:Uncharacterized protein n=1 Tax=Anaerosacchariphilus polymeriproducens TaxID=1812858 RepID=A0A371AUI8_9FIRM|nr:hypothetical protein [Anaerosacchariphilus polymeriproducens]RDU23221.1 hypothetical protein DWV06_10600 [Anaerosacchariphilus polymeriproducens]